MTPLSQLHCTPVHKEDRPLSEDEIRDFAREIPEWKVVERGGLMQIEREFRFKNFSAALAFTVQVGELAEAEDHHPALLTEWGRVTAAWWTHRIGGLHRNDFIMAAKTDDVYASIDPRSG
ncbi:MAG: 4a-hydroxytetrahydrobiopterin dehydratase [Anaerolineales bacterium]|jgi:4a-hydroxytetrahydrobiopterin dehydratase